MNKSEYMCAKWAIGHVQCCAPEHFPLMIIGKILFVLQTKNERDVLSLMPGAICFVQQAFHVMRRQRMAVQIALDIVTPKFLQ